MSDGASEGKRKLKENTVSAEYGKDDIDNTESHHKSPSFFTNFSNVIVEGLFETVEINNKNRIYTTADHNGTITVAPAPPHFEGLPATLLFECGIAKSEEGDSYLINKKPHASNCNGILVEKCEDYPSTVNDHQIACTNPVVSQISPKSSCYSSLEGNSLESGVSTVSFVTEIEIKCGEESDVQFFKLQNDVSNLKMDESVGESSEKLEEGAAAVDETPTQEEDGAQGEFKEKEEIGDGNKDTGTTTTPTTEDEGGGVGYCEDDEDDDTTTLSSEAVVDDIELILMPEMCQDLPQSNLSPKLVRVTELKVNMDDVFGDEDDDDQSSRHEFRSIVDEICEEEQDASQNPQDEHNLSRFSVGDDDVSSGSEFVGGSGTKGASLAEGDLSKRSSSSSSGRRRRSTSGRISSGVQTDITALEEPSALSSHHGFRKKTSGKSSSARLGVPGGSAKKLNWKSELTLLPSKMKVKQAGFNSFESNDERDQYSPRVAKFTSQDTLNLSSQFLKPSTLYRTRNLSRNLNQFASSESTFMLPMSSEQQLSAESPRFRDRVSSSTSGAAGNFKGATTSHSYSAYQISSMLSGSASGGGGGSCGIGFGTSYYVGGGANISSRRQPLISGYSGGSMMSGNSCRHFRSSMPDLNAVNKSYPTAAATMADSHRKRIPPKSIKHHHSSSGFRLQKRSSSDEETSSLIDESERCLRSSIDLLLTDELPSPGDSCFRSAAAGFGSSSLAAISTGFYSGRRSCSQPILNDQAYPPEMRDPAMGSPFLPRKLSDMRICKFAKVILPNGNVAVVAIQDTDEIQDSLTVHTDTGCVINLPFRKVVFAWKTKR